MIRQETVKGDIAAFQSAYDVFRVYPTEDGLKDEHLLVTVSLQKAEALIEERTKVKDGSTYILALRWSCGVSMYRTDGGGFDDDVTSMPKEPIQS